MAKPDDTLDQEVRWQVYDHTMRTGAPPLAQDVAAALRQDAGAIRGSLARLGAAHILVLQPAEHLRLAREAVDRSLISGKMFGHHLDRHRTLQAQLHAVIDCPHGATTEQSIETQGVGLPTDERIVSGRGHVPV